MAFVKLAHTYFAALYPNGDNFKEKARINLFCQEEYRLFIRFQKEPLSQNSYNPGNKTGNAYIDFGQYPNYIDMVRNEKPIRVTFNPDSAPPIFVVAVGEPVGEEEGV